MSERQEIVAVIDDDLSVRRGLDRLLRSAGYRVATFASARDFLEHSGYDGLACLVIDVSMPGQSGLDLHEMLSGAGHDIPVVFVTGHGDISMAVRAMKAGAVDFLPKPFDDRTFLDAVQRAIAKHRQPAQRRVPQS